MSLQLLRAAAADREVLLGFIEAFNLEQGYAFERGRGGRVLDELLSDPALGGAWLLEVDGTAAGYLVLGFGFSLEYGGRDAFLDEFYLVPEARGRGHGRAALEAALDEARRLGLQAVHLEVEDDNPRARRLYAATGFAGNERRLLSRRLDR